VIATGSDLRVASAEDVWTAAHLFPTGVSVVTTGTGDAIHGSTVSAFSFVSREPPLIGVCLSRHSTLLAFIRERSCFTVNVLSTEQTGLARHFASRQRGSGRHQFDGLDWDNGDCAVPKLAHTVCWLHCHEHDRLPAGDHVLVLASVRSLAHSDLTPLLYFAGSLHPGAIHIPGPSTLRMP
jgi:flavin reductase (DIM6/NTAB) family NADH-FMN oxidoreductase RutF